MGDTTEPTAHHTHMTGQTPDGMRVRVEFTGPRLVALTQEQQADLLWALLEDAEVAYVRTRYEDMRRAVQEGRTDG